MEKQFHIELECPRCWCEISVTTPDLTVKSVEEHDPLEWVRQGQYERAMLGEDTQHSINILSWGFK